MSIKRQLKKIQKQVQNMPQYRGCSVYVSWEINTLPGSKYSARYLILVKSDGRQVAFTCLKATVKEALAGLQEDFVRKAQMETTVSTS